MHQHLYALPGEHAANQPYLQHAPTIFAHIRRHTATVEDAEDILVEVFVAALENEQFSTLPEQEQQVWLWRVARNKIVDAYRRQSYRHSIPLEQINDTVDENDAMHPEQVAIRLDEEMHVHRMLQQLSPLQRQIIQLRFGKDLRCKEIASVVGKREGAVRMLLSRALNALRSIYDKQEGEATK